MKYVVTVTKQNDTEFTHIVRARSAKQACDGVESQYGCGQIKSIRAKLSKPVATPIAAQWAALPYEVRVQLFEKACVARCTPGMGWASLPRDARNSLGQVWAPAALVAPLQVWLFIEQRSTVAMYTDFAQWAAQFVGFELVARQGHTDDLAAYSEADTPRLACCYYGEADIHKEQLLRGLWEAYKTGHARGYDAGAKDADDYHTHR